MKPRNDIPIEFLRECLDLDVEAGALIWRVRPREHFATERQWKTWNARFAGKTAGSPSGGYLRFGLTVRNRRRRSMKAHRVVFALTLGRWPPDELDHRNGVGAANQMANLREATRGENVQNVRRYRSNTSGFPGVSKSPHRCRKPWMASIQAGGCAHYLGTFDTPEEAHARYLKAKAQLHAFQPTPRQPTSNL